MGHHCSYLSRFSYHLRADRSRLLGHSPELILSLFWRSYPPGFHSVMIKYNYSANANKYNCHAFSEYLKFISSKIVQRFSTSDYTPFAKCFSCFTDPLTLSEHNKSDEGQLILFSYDFHVCHHLPFSRLLLLCLSVHQHRQPAGPPTEGNMWGDDPWPRVSCPASWRGPEPPVYRML